MVRIILPRGAGCQVVAVAVLPVASAFREKRTVRWQCLVTARLARYRGGDSPPAIARSDVSPGRRGGLESSGSVQRGRHAR